MSVFWTSDLETGVETIDNQHKELISRINALFTACSQGKGKEEVVKIMGFLGDYVVFHFGEEEKYMENLGYPAYSSHKKEHQGFINNFSELREKMGQDGPTVEVVVRANKLLIDWLINHIKRVDKEFANFMKSKG